MPLGISHCLYLDLNGKRPGITSDGKFSSYLKKKSFGQKQNLNSMHGLKSAILAISPEIGQLAGLAMPCQCSPPFPPIENDRKWLYQLLPIKYELNLPSEVMPGLLPFRSRSKQCE